MYEETPIERPLYPSVSYGSLFTFTLLLKGKERVLGNPVIFFLRTLVCRMSENTDRRKLVVLQTH